jgi:hypothetical protein
VHEAEIVLKQRITRGYVSGGTCRPAGSLVH